MLAHDRIHLPGGEVLETGPAEVVVLATLGVGTLGEDARRHRLLQHQRFALFQRMRVIQPPDEQQVGDLFNHLQRIGNAARPEGIPDSVDLAAKFASEHIGRCLKAGSPAPVASVIHQHSGR